MAQVYSFVDENGATRLFAEIHPDPAGTPFNGGTITAGLAIADPDPNETQLLVTGASLENNTIIQVDSFDGSTAFYVYGDGADGVDGVQLSSGTTLTLRSDAVTDIRAITKMTLRSPEFIYLNANAAPASGDLAAGNFALWYDKTQDASKLMVKAKQNDGTVVTAALPVTPSVVAPATQAFVSGAAAQVLPFDAETHTPVTFNPGVATTATCKIELSPDNVTFATLAIVTKPVGTVFDGTIEDLVVRVPGQWYLRFTVVNATLGTTTYY